MSTALGGSALPLILQKQATHGTQSMGFLLFFPQLSTLVSMPLSPPTALGGSLPFTCRLFGSACLKTEELRWGSPTATPPFEPLDLEEQKGSGLFFGSEFEPRIDDVKC